MNSIHGFIMKIGGKSVEPDSSVDSIFIKLEALTTGYTHYDKRIVRKAAESSLLKEFDAMNDYKHWKETKNKKFLKAANQKFLDNLNSEFNDDIYEVNLRYVALTYFKLKDYKNAVKYLLEYGGLAAESNKDEAENYALRYLTDACLKLILDPKLDQGKKEKYRRVLDEVGEKGMFFLGYGQEGIFENALRVEQKEIGYIAPGIGSGLIGTDNIHDCIVIILQNHVKETCIAHIDKNTRIKSLGNAFIKLAPNGEELKCRIIGGRYYDKYCNNEKYSGRYWSSRRNIKKVLKFLKNKNIDIVSSCIANKGQPSSVIVDVRTFEIVRGSPGVIDENAFIRISQLFGNDHHEKKDLIVAYEFDNRVKKDLVYNPVLIDWDHDLIVDIDEYEREFCDNYSKYSKDMLFPMFYPMIKAVNIAYYRELTSVISFLRNSFLRLGYVDDVFIKKVISHFDINLYIGKGCREKNDIIKSDIKSYIDGLFYKSFVIQNKCNMLVEL